MLLNLYKNIMDTILTKCGWRLVNSNNTDKLGQTALTISILILSLLWCILMVINKSRKARVLLPPGPRGLPIIGYLPFLGTNLHHEFTDLARHYGPIFKLQLGNKLCVVLSSPSLIKEVTRDQDALFANRDPPVAVLAMTYGGFDIVWSSYGSYWRNMRKLFVREMLSGSNLEGSYDLRKGEVRKTIEYVSTKVGKAIDIGELTFVTEINVIMSMLWGSTLEANQQSKVGAEFREVFSKIIELLSKPNISDLFPILARFDIQGTEKKAKALLQRVEKIFDAVINERTKTWEAELKHAAERKDFIQILLELKKQKNGGVKINMEQVKAILMDIVIAGTDTTAIMVEWAMVELVHHREVMEKVQKELEEVVGMKNMVEEFHLCKLHYLEAVMKETLRLHPALPLLVPKRPSESCTVGGYTIPKDTRVLVNAWAIQRDPQLWDDPLVFRPERFLSEPSKWDYSGNNFQYIPFGSGRRVCAGIPLAEKMVMYVLASLLHSFDWKPTQTKEADLSEKFGLVTRKATPFLAVPTKRSHK